MKAKIAGDSLTGVVTCPVCGNLTCERGGGSTRIQTRDGLPPGEEVKVICFTCSVRITHEYLRTNPQVRVSHHG